MTIIVDLGDGRIVEFPDVETAQRFVSRPSEAALRERDTRKSVPVADRFSAEEMAALQQAGGQRSLATGGPRMEQERIAAQRAEGERIGAAITDVPKALGAGLTRGTAGLLALPEMAERLGAQAGTFAAEQAAGALGMDRGQQAQATQAAISQAPTAMGRLSQATGGASEFRGETTPGQFAGTVGEFLPGAAMFGGASPANLARFGVAPGVASEAAGQATEGTSLEPFARIAGALAAPVGLSAAENVARRVISPAGGAEAARLQAASVLEREGVKLTAGQTTGNETQLFREAATSAGRQMVDDQARQFTRAVLRRVGADADTASPEVLVAASRRIGSVFDDVAKGVDVAPTPDMLTRLSQTLTEYSQLATKSARAPIVAEINRKIVQAFRGGNSLKSSQVLSWRSALSKLTRTGDAATRDAAINAMNALDDGLSQSLRALGREADIGRLAEARSQWQSLIAIENAVTRAGEKAATGIITPANLRNALAMQGRRAFAQGRGELNELARAGVATMQPLPQSGTQPRSLARELTAGASGGTAAGLGSFGLGADPVLATAIGATAVAAPRARNAFLASPAGQAYMRNQLLGSGRELVDSRMISGLLSGVPAQQ